MTAPERVHLPGGLVAPPEDGPWVALGPGVDAVWLYRDEHGGPAAAYLRYRAGARVPLHAHPDTEHVFVISGAQEDEYGRYPAGSVVINPPGSRHSVASPEGCVVLVIWARQVAFLERSGNRGEE